MNVTSWFRAALVGAAILVIGVGAAFAQSEMTDKIRLENATPAQYDFAVTGANLGITKVGGGTKVGFGTTAPEETLHVEGATGPGTVALYVNPTGPARFRFRNGSNNETWNVGHQSPSGTGLVFSDVGDAFSEMLLDVNGNLTIIGSLTQGSDVNRKTGIEPIASEQILDKVARLPISEWSYKEDPAVRHVGPMAQDFKAAFGLGATETGIAAVDADGISLASIQALYELVQQQRSEIQGLRERLEKLETK
jgi:hypothetical protein